MGITRIVESKADLGENLPTTRHPGLCGSAPTADEKG